MIRKKNEASICNHSGANKDSQSYEVLRHGKQKENKALIKMPMEGRLYHIK
jgi:hypothetical protein